MEMNELIETSEKIRRVWRVYEEEYLDGQFHYDTYKGFDTEGNAIRVYWERTHRALMKEDDEYSELMSMVITPDTFGMSDAELKEYFAMGVEKDNILKEIAEHDTEIKVNEDQIGILEKLAIEYDGDVSRDFKDKLKITIKLCLQLEGFDDEIKEYRHDFSFREIFKFIVEINKISNALIYKNNELGYCVESIMSMYDFETFYKKFEWMEKLKST